MARRAADPAAGAAAAPDGAARTGCTLELPALGMVLLTDDALAQLANAVALRLDAQYQQHLQQTHWVTVAQAAVHLATSTHRIYRLVHMRRIPHHKEGQRVLFDCAELDAWVRNGGARRVAT